MTDLFKLYTFKIFYYLVIQVFFYQTWKGYYTSAISVYFKIKAFLFKRKKRMFLRFKKLALLKDSHY
jgi:hypothetical protein